MLEKLNKLNKKVYKMEGKLINFMAPTPSGITMRIDFVNKTGILKLLK